MKSEYLKHVITPEEAQARELWQLSTPLVIPQQQWIMEGMIRDQAKVGEQWAVVQVGPGQVEVWRGGIRLDYLSGYKAGVQSSSKYNLAHADSGNTYGRRKGRIIQA